MSVIDDAPSEDDSGETATSEYKQTPLIRIEGLSKRYNGVQALDDVSFDVRDNEVLAIIGDNGAGKSTAIKCLAGVISPTGGSIFVRTDGQLEERTLDSPNDAKEAGIETVFQELQLSKQHDVASNVFMGREPLKPGLEGSLLRRIDRDRMEQEATEALKEIGFAVDTTARTAELSGGQQQAVSVARALISDPHVVLLDEPTAEVSIDGSEKILNLIHQLQERGRTVIFISHNLEEVFEVADRIVVLRGGRLVDILENDDKIDREYIVGLMTGAISK